jgi:hypothetical protein
MSLEQAMFVIIVSALGRVGACVPVQPALGADDDATDLNHGTTLGQRKIHWKLSVIGGTARFTLQEFGMRRVDAGKAATGPSAGALLAGVEDAPGPRSRHAQ